MKVYVQFAIVMLGLAFFNNQVLAQNQNKRFNDFGSGSYTTYKAESFYVSSSNSYKQKLEKVSKQWPVELKEGGAKDFDGNKIIETVVISRQGVIKESFVPDIAENPVYFGFKDFRLSIIDDKIYQYEWSNDNAKIIYILTKSSVNSYDSEKETLENFIRASFKTQLAAKGKLNEVKEANAKKDAIENSLKGKNIKSLEIQIVDLPKEFGLKSTVKFGIKATTSDGKVYSTPNIGGKTAWDDFIVKTTDGVFVDEAIETHEDASKITNDELRFTVSSKYSPAVTIQKAIPLNYALTNYNLRFNGRDGYQWMNDVGGVMQAMRGEDALSLDIKIQKATTKNTNLPIYKIEITNAKTGKIMNRIKVLQSTIVNIYALGGRGDKGADRKDRKGDDGKDGGAGGNITILKNTDAADINLNVINTGGAGGKGGNSSSSIYNGLPGNNGRNGTVVTKALSSNLNW